MVKNPFVSAWLRLGSAFLVLLLVSVVFWTETRRSPYSGGDVGRALKDSAEVVVTGPVFPLFIAGKSAGIAGTVLFWIVLLSTACGSGRHRVRRWFYVLFGVFAVMTLVWIPTLYFFGAAFVLAL